MKKIIALFLVIIFLTSAWLPTAHAEEKSYVEARWIIWETNIDKNLYCYYVRFDENVSLNADALHVEYTKYGSDAVLQLDADFITSYTEDRLELFLRFPNSVGSIVVTGLVLKDGASVEQRLNKKDFKEIDSLGMDWTWLFMKRDALYSPKFFQGSLEDCDVAVGSRWKLRFIGLFFPRDAYLRAHTTLAAEGIELTQDGDEYQFNSVGEGKVSLCLFGIPRCTGNVRVMEKQTLKLRMIATTPIQYMAVPIIALRFLGPLALILGIPFVICGTLVTYSRMIFA